MSDPGRPAPAYDVVGDDSERWRPSRRWVAGVLVLVVAVTGTVVGVRSVQADHARQRRDLAVQRRAEAAFRVADQVHLSVVPGSVIVVSDLENRTVPSLSAQVDIQEQGPFADQVSGIELVGEALTPGTYDAPVLQGAAGTTQGLARSSVDCSGAAAGRLPTAATLRVSIVTAAGRTHVQSLPVEASRLREAVLVTCDLPDPDLRPTAFADVQDGRLSAQVEQVLRARTPLVLLGVTGPGLRVTLELPRLPLQLPADTGIGFRMRARVVDCAAARRGPLRLTAVVVEGGRRALLPVADNVLARPGPQHLAGVRPVAPYLRALVARRCP